MPLMGVAAGKQLDVAVVAECLVCADLFVVVVDLCPQPGFFGKGRRAEDARAALLEEMQDMHCGEPRDEDARGGADARGEKAQRDDSRSDDWCLDAFIARPPQPPPAPRRRAAPALARDASRGWFSTFGARRGRWRGFHLLPCPTCAECTTGLPHAAYLRDRDRETVFSPCRFYKWAADEAAPLYVDARNDAAVGKPKWTLVQGLGPKTLEQDHSRSGRLWKPALNLAPKYHFRGEENLAPARAAAILDAVLAAIALRLDGAGDDLWPGAPLFRSWSAETASDSPPGPANSARPP
ncbi:hypothetical protein M885DRAFT_548047 [Pelagophyceae sp. CCMP2097]|nr:hypothetical protein M885DRAFT_548047 [Pelagophyceae sp. CCMP2097]